MNEPYITVTSGMSGYFPVWLTWNSEHGGFYEPYLTGDTHKLFDLAQREAKGWAKTEGIEYH